MIYRYFSFYFVDTFTRISGISPSAAAGCRRAPEPRAASPGCTGAARTRQPGALDPASCSPDVAQEPPTIHRAGVAVCFIPTKSEIHPSFQKLVSQSRRTMTVLFSSKKSARRQSKEISCHLFLPVAEKGQSVIKSSYQQCKKKYLCYYEYIIKSQSSYTHFSILYINKVNSIVIGMCKRNKHMDFLKCEINRELDPTPTFCCCSGTWYINSEILLGRRLCKL